MPIVSDNELNRRRRDIIEQTRRCFARYGYEGATVSRLEEATGKTRGAIFHHFRDKEELFLAIAAEDAARQAEVVAEHGLIEVMRRLVAEPDNYDWYITRAEIVRKLRTDPEFGARWRGHQAVLDEALRARLADNEQTRSDVSPDVIQEYLTTVMEGLITRLASGERPDRLERMLDLVEQSVRTPGAGV